MPRGLIGTLWYYSTQIIAGATACSAGKGRMSSCVVCIGKRCAPTRPLCVCVRSAVMDACGLHRSSQCISDNAGHVDLFQKGWQLLHRL
ncbi:hypothetical protein EIM45_18030 [Xanthomonas vasicola pv. musacearum]|nr:hypothetical protein EIM45_18030 [Xanthomonas vasicola pv. musacearum]